MPTFIPARGRTLHLAGVCVNRIGTVYSNPHHCGALAADFSPASPVAHSVPSARRMRILKKDDGAPTDPSLRMASCLSSTVMKPLVSP